MLHGTVFAPQAHTHVVMVSTVATVLVAAAPSAVICRGLHDLVEAYALPNTVTVLVLQFAVCVTIIALAYCRFRRGVLLLVAAVLLNIALR